MDSESINLGSNPSPAARLDDTSSPPRRLLNQSRAKQNILFLSEEKIRCAQKEKSEECFAWWRALGSGGGAAFLVRIGLVKSSDFIQDRQPS